MEPVFESATRHGIQAGICSESTFLSSIYAKTYIKYT